MRLATLLKLNGQAGKMGAGCDAPGLWADGKLEQLERYCQRDVEALAELVTRGWTKVPGGGGTDHMDVSSEIKRGETIAQDEAAHARGGRSGSRATREARPSSGELRSGSAASEETPTRRGRCIRDRAQEEPRRAETLHRGGASYGTPSGSGRIRVARRRVPSTRGKESAGVGGVAHMGPGGLKRRQNREAHAHADNDGRHETTRQDENTARYTNNTNTIHTYRTPYPPPYNPPAALHPRGT